MQHEGAATALTAGVPHPPPSSYVHAPATLTDRTANSSQREARRSKFYTRRYGRAEPRARYVDDA